MFKSWMKVQFPDGTWIYGYRKLYWFFVEVKTHHIKVTDTSPTWEQLIGKKIAVPIYSAQFFVLDAGWLSGVNRHLKASADPPRVSAAP